MRKSMLTLDFLTRSARMVLNKMAVHRTGVSSLIRGTRIGIGVNGNVFYSILECSFAVHVVHMNIPKRDVILLSRYNVVEPNQVG